MRIISTSDVSLMQLQQKASLLPLEWHAEVDEAQMFFRSMEVPSWVSVVAEASWWVQFLAASASVYISGIISEAGKDTWKNRSKIVAMVKRAPAAIATLAQFLVSAQATDNSKTFVSLEIPILNEHNTARLRLTYSSLEELEFSIALFVCYVPLLESLWKTECLENKRPVGGMKLEFGEDCSLLVTWMDVQSLTIQERILALPEGR